jgi:predicted lipoprotein
MFLNRFLWASIMLGVLLVLLVFINTAQATTSWASSNQALVDQHILPRYVQLVESTQALNEQTKQFCVVRDEARFTALRAAYHQAMDDWMRVQHIRLGPVGMFLRYNRYQHWPDKHGTGTKQLRLLLAGKNIDALNAGQFSRSSVAVQGFTALERLLFPQQVNLDAFSKAGVAGYRCHLLSAITDNLARMSAGIVNDWQGGEINYREVIATADKGNAYYGNEKDVSGVLLNDLHTQLQSIMDQKLMRPMERFRMKRAESWRSRRSLRNIELNLQACMEMYEIGFAPHVPDSKLQQKIMQGFTQSIALAQGINIPLYAIQQTSPEAQQLEKLLAQVKGLKRLVATDLLGSLNLVLGFNSLDGD